MDNAIEKRMDELRKQAGQFAKAEAEYTYLYEFRKSKLAMLQKHYALQGFDTVAAQDRESRADNEYKKLLTGLKIATEEKTRLFWELKIAMLGAELWRTQQATKRAEIKGYGA